MPLKKIQNVGKLKLNRLKNIYDSSDAKNMPNSNNQKIQLQNCPL